MRLWATDKFGDSKNMVRFTFLYDTFASAKSFFLGQAHISLKFMSQNIAPRQIQGE